MTKLSVAVPAARAAHLPYFAYYGALGTWRARRPDQTRRAIVVAGSPRSGTTWLGDIVAALADRVLLMEPTHAHTVPEMRDGHQWDGRPFREPDEPDDELAADLERVLTGTYLGPGMVKRARSIDGPLWARRPVVSKLIDVNLLLPWMARHLDWLTMVHIVRNPLAVVASQEARSESLWSRRTELGRPYQRFMAAHPAYAGPVAFDSVAESLVASWALEHAWLRDRRDDLDGVIRLRYEDLRAEVTDGARDLAARLGLPEPSAEVVAGLSRPSRTVNQAASTLGEGANAAWRARYDEPQRERLLAILSRYDFPFYGADEF